jgi:Undecaprenyl-phosphate glucose phosphotransferase
MLRRYNPLVNLLNRMADATVVTLAWLGAFPLRFTVEWVWGPEAPPPFHVYAALAPVVALLWMGVFGAFGLYTSRRILSLRSELSRMLRAHAMAFVLFMVLAYFINQYKYSRGLMLIFAMTSTVALCAVRIGIRKILRGLRRRGFNQRRALVVGVSPAAHEVVRQFEAFPELGIDVIGAVTRAGSAGETVAGRPVIGAFDDLRQICRRHDVLDVVVALPASEQSHLDTILEDLKHEHVTVRVIPDMSAYAVLGCLSEDFNGLPLLHLNESPMDAIAATAKRGLDIVGALAAFVIFSPVLLAVAIAVKLTSRGPLLYAQERMGLDGRRFKMYKFRSMRIDAEAEAGARWAKKGDDRRTPVGAFIRRTSLDELPQLWNVLWGDMSLVGPRPERPVFVERFREEIPQYMLRHKVKSGMTGWAQVNGWRGDTCLERRIACDIYYIRNWSLLLDLRILWMTIFKGFVNENAY